ncbi:hypothetical protein J0910_29975 [Nocardiopsis sp. CNT-189]|uniref:hypothetical protein n=1 Tax=Nocardiopsis oceanisediminis TaxID=2816862 RepID=UPI003B2E2284
MTILSGIVTGLITTISAPFRWIYNWLVGNSLVPDLVNGSSGCVTSLRTGLRRSRCGADWIVARVNQMRLLALIAVTTLRIKVAVRVIAVRDKARRSGTP